MTDIARERRLLAAEGLVFHTRETWGAQQDYRSARSVIEPAVGFAFHIAVTNDTGDLTGTEHVDMRTIERIGQQRFGIGVSYNAAVFDTARLYEGQPLTRRGAHTVDDKGIGYPSMGSSRSMNFHWRAICLPQQVTDDVTDGQVDQCARWAAAQVRAGLARRDAIWIGHRDVAWKSCPGDAGYDRLPDIRRLTEHYIVNGLGPTITVPQEDDEVFYVRVTDHQGEEAIGGPGYFHHLNREETNVVKDQLGRDPRKITLADYHRLRAACLHGERCANDAKG